MHDPAAPPPRPPVTPPAVGADHRTPVAPPSAGTDPAPPAPVDPAPGPTDEEAGLDALEADLVAVAEAMASLDRIAADGSGGDAAAGQIGAVVSADRFPVEDDTVDLTAT